MKDLDLIIKENRVKKLVKEGKAKYLGIFGAENVVLYLETHLFKIGNLYKSRNFLNIKKAPVYKKKELCEYHYNISSDMYCVPSQDMTKSDIEKICYNPEKCFIHNYFKETKNAQFFWRK
jgi:hypothetical protein